MKKLVVFLVTALLALSIFVGGCAKKETVPVEKATETESPSTESVAK